MTYVVISLVALDAVHLRARAAVRSDECVEPVADLADKIADLPPGLRGAFAVLLLVVFGIKAGLFPLFFWLPDS